MSIHSCKGMSDSTRFLWQVNNCSYGNVLQIDDAIIFKCHAPLELYGSIDECVFCVVG